MVSNPGYHSAYEAVALSERLERMHRAPIHKSEVSGVSRNLESGYFLEDSIERECEELLGSGFALPASSLSIDNIVSITPALEHLRNEFGRILEVCIENYDHLALGLIQSTGDSELMAKVASQANGLYEALLLRILADERPSVVLAAVIDQHDLKRAGVSSNQIFQAAS
jgi:hypothetical protein